MKRFKLLLFSLMTVLLSFLTPAAASAETDIRDLLFPYYSNSSSYCQAGLPIANGSIDRFLQVLAYQESSNNPTAETSGSSASGKYQYIDSTWRARYDLYGPASAYARASQAPEAIQDAVAYIEYTETFRDLDNDIFKLAVNHFYPRANSDPSLLDTKPGNNSITVREYADKLIQNIGKSVGSDIPLLYSQAPEFDIWLSKVGGAAPTVNGATFNNESPSGSCNDSQVYGGTIVEIAQRELAGGAREIDGTYLKYTGGVEADWCAYFVSWVLREAGNPLDPDPMPAVASILAYAKNNGTFHPKGEIGFTPQPGDIAIYKEGVGLYPSHVNIVISYEPAANKYTSIGGNESDKIMQANLSAEGSSLTGFMRVQ